MSSRHARNRNGLILYASETLGGKCNQVRSHLEFKIFTLAYFRS